MPGRPLHGWDLSPERARALQVELAGRVDVRTPLPAWKTVAAADVSFERFGRWIYAAVVVLDGTSLEILEEAGAVREASFPYVPGLLSFREAPAVLDAFARLKSRPDILMCDGQGIAHPRRLGLACHLGLWLGLPTVGCAKSRLCGTSDEPGPDRGDSSPLVDKGEVVGAVLRTKARVSPLFISPGHLCDLAGAVDVVLRTATTRRLPVPSLRAHEAVNALRRKGGGA